MADFFGNDYELYDTGGFDLSSDAWSDLDSFDFGSWNWWDGFNTSEVYLPNESELLSYYSPELFSSSAIDSQAFTGPQLDMSSDVVKNEPSNFSPVAVTANMPLQTYQFDDWGTGSNYTSGYTLDTLPRSAYGSQLPEQSVSSWKDKFANIADKIVERLPSFVLSALTPKPKIPGDKALHTLEGVINRSNAFNDRLAADYSRGMPILQNNALDLVRMSTPSEWARSAAVAADISNAARRRALERQLFNVSPDARAAALARFDTGANAARVGAYNEGLGKGLAHNMQLTTQAANLFPQPNYSAVGSLAALGANTGANRAIQENALWRDYLSGMAGLLGGREEGEKKGMRTQTFA